MKKVMKAVAALMLMAAVVCAAGCTPEDNNTVPEVETAIVTQITESGAIAGGIVISDGGSKVTERGVCWNKSGDPTVGDFHVASGNGTGSYSCALSDLESNTTYHVRAYAINGEGICYGSDVNFTTFDNGGNGGGNGGGNCTLNGHEFVDLGLPSGTLWATCNVGASSSEDYGEYYAWGEITTKTYYDDTNYRWCNGNIRLLTKYCNNPIYGDNNFVDYLMTLEDEDDVAFVKWGDRWRIPTIEQWMELTRNTTQTVVGKGLLLKSANGKTLLLPAAGYHTWMDSDIHLGGSAGGYWSNSLSPGTIIPYCAWYFRFGSDSDYASNIRWTGWSIRPCALPNKSR